jgi:hypothetical protein
MVEKTQSFQDSFQDKNQQFDKISEAASEVKADIEKFVEGFDMRALMSRVEEFGKQNPFGLALSALTLGLAAGLLMRGSKKLPNP